MPPDDDTLVNLQVMIPDDMHRRLKATAALNGLTMRNAVMEALGSWCTRNQVPLDTPAP